MNIIWITTQFPREENDTKGIFIYRTVYELSKHFSIHVIVLRPVTFHLMDLLKNPGQFKKILSLLIANFKIKKYPEPTFNFDVINIKYFRIIRGPLWFLEGYFAYRSTKKHIKNVLDQDTIIHANWLFPEGKLATLISKEFKVPYILTIRGGDIQKLRVGSTNWKHAKKIVNDASKVTSVSSNLLELCKQKGIEIEESKEVITHNFYDVSKFTIQDRLNCRENLGINEGVKVIFFVGGLIPRKNIPLLLNSMFELKDLFPQLKLYIAGEGLEEERLKKLSQKLNLVQNISFLGRINSDIVVQYMNASNVLCLPSKSEGLPNVVVESLLCGTPVVATAVNEIPFIIRDGLNGYLVKSDSFEELTESLKKTLEKDWDRTELRESVSYLFPGTILKEYQTLYQSVYDEFK